MFLQVTVFQFSLHERWAVKNLFSTYVWINFFARHPKKLDKKIVRCH